MHALPIRASLLALVCLSSAPVEPSPPGGTRPAPDELAAKSRKTFSVEGFTLKVDRETGAHECTLAAVYRWDQEPKFSAGQIREIIERENVRRKARGQEAWRSDVTTGDVEVERTRPELHVLVDSAEPEDEGIILYQDLVDGEVDGKSISFRPKFSFEHRKKYVIKLYVICQFKPGLGRCPVSEHAIKFVNP